MDGFALAEAARACNDRAVCSALITHLSCPRARSDPKCNISSTERTRKPRPMCSPSSSCTFPHSPPCRGTATRTPTGRFPHCPRRTAHPRTHCLCPETRDSPRLLHVAVFLLSPAAGSSGQHNTVYCIQATVADSKAVSSLGLRRMLP